MRCLIKAAATPPTKGTTHMSPTSQRASAQASSADLNINKTRIAFMERASAPNIPPHAFKLAWLIAYRYMNRKTWTAYPPQERLARDLNVSVRTVQRLLDILEPLGLTIVPGDGRGYASTYAIDPERATRMSSFAARKGDKKGRQKAPKRVSPVSPQPIENQEESFVGELKLSPQRLERNNRASRDDSSSIGGGPLDASADLFGHHAERPETKTETVPVAPKRTPEGECAEGAENQLRHGTVSARKKVLHGTTPSPRGVATARKTLPHRAVNSEPSPCGTAVVQNNLSHGGTNSGRHSAATLLKFEECICRATRALGSGMGQRRQPEGASDRAQCLRHGMWRRCRPRRHRRGGEDLGRRRRCAALPARAGDMAGGERLGDAAANETQAAREYPLRHGKFPQQRLCQARHVQDRAGGRRLPRRRRRPFVLVRRCRR